MLRPKNFSPNLSDRVASADASTAAQLSPPLPQLRRGRTVGLVGVLTVVVSVMGYLREAALATRFGVSATMDAYFGAIFIPNIVYSALILGTLSPVLIPILVKGTSEEGSADLSEKVSVVINFAILLLLTIVLAGVFSARVWVPLLFPGYSPPTVAMTMRLSYIVFPAVIFLAIAGILTAILNGFHKFALAAFAPALSSLTVMGAALGFRGENAIYFVGIATAVGFLLQALLLLPAVRTLGIEYRPVFYFRHPAIRKLLKVGVPLFLWLAVANAILILERNLASRLSAGAVSTLSYALRLCSAPSSFLAAPLAIVAYPLFAREAAREGGGDLPSHVSQVFRLVVFLFSPVTVFVIINALPVTRLLYERGHFLEADSFAIARVLSLYGVGILPSAITVVLLRCFFAIEDTLTPLMTELAALVFFLMVAPLLTHHFGIQGLVITRAITFFLGATILVLVLWKRNALLRFNFEFGWFFLRTMIATLAMGVVSWTSLHLLQLSFDSGAIFVRSGIVLLQLLLSGGTFLIASNLLRLAEAKQLLDTARSLAFKS